MLRLLFAVAIFLFLITDELYAASGCRLELGNTQVDYRAQDEFSKKHIYNVERAHFTTSVRLGQHGNTGSLMADLDYTLRHIPNHHQALMVLINHQLGKNFTSRDRQRWESIDCYLRRARIIAPGDSSVMVIGGIYYHKTGKYQEAEDYYQKALQKSSSKAQTSEIYYNLGLLYVDMKEYQKARQYADKAYSMNYPLKGLKRKLQHISSAN